MTFMWATLKLYIYGVDKKYCMAYPIAGFVVELELKQQHKFL